MTRIRAGRGPQFVELETYRWREHCGPNYDNDLGYRTEEFIGQNYIQLTIPAESREDELKRLNERLVQEAARQHLGADCGHVQKHGQTPGAEVENLHTATKNKREDKQNKTSSY